jgi:hypothetical protein
MAGDYTHGVRLLKSSWVAGARIITSHHALKRCNRPNNWGGQGFIGSPIREMAGDYTHGRPGRPSSHHIMRGGATTV